MRSSHLGGEERERKEGKGEEEEGLDGKEEEEEEYKLMLDYKLLTQSHRQVLLSHAKGRNEDGTRYDLQVSQFLIAAVSGIVNVIHIVTGTWR